MSAGTGTSGEVMIYIGRTHDGRIYGTVNGITKGSITCYFTPAGELAATTLRVGRLRDTYDGILREALVQIDVLAAVARYDASGELVAQEVAR